MARKADTDLPRRREKSGDRLKEEIRKKELKPTQFLQMMKKQYGTLDETSEDGYYLEGLNSIYALSKVCNGHATLQNKHARMAAELLGIDVNYLLGTVDDFNAETYDDYVNYYLKDAKTIPEQNRIFDYYQKALAPYGVNVKGMSATDDKINDFDITSDGVTTTITALEMEQLYQDIKDYIHISVKRLRMKHPNI